MLEHPSVVVGLNTVGEMMSPILGIMGDGGDGNGFIHAALTARSSWDCGDMAETLDTARARPKVLIPVSEWLSSGFTKVAPLHRGVLVLLKSGHGSPASRSALAECLWNWFEPNPSQPQYGNETIVDPGSE